MSMKTFALTLARCASARASRVQPGRPAVLLLGLLCLAPSLPAQESDGAPNAPRHRDAARTANAHKSPLVPQKLTQDGVSVEFSVEPSVRRERAAPLEGETVTLTFRIREAAGLP